MKLVCENFPKTPVILTGSFARPANGYPRPSASYSSAAFLGAGSSSTQLVLNITQPDRTRNPL